MAPVSGGAGRAGRGALRRRWGWPLALALALHGLVLLFTAGPGGYLSAQPVAESAAARLVWLPDAQPPSMVVAQRPVETGEAARPAPLASAPAASTLSAVHLPPAEAAVPAEAAAPGSPQAGPGYDVPPVPKDGWLVDASALLTLLPGSAAPTAWLEFEVDETGVIRQWRLLDTNADLLTMLRLLDGVQHTPMVPATLAGRAVGARLVVEMTFSE